jgi:hypothetical protein
VNHVEQRVQEALNYSCNRFGKGMCGLARAREGTTSVVPLIPERRRALAPAVSFTVEKSKPQALKRRQISSILWHD